MEKVREGYKITELGEIPEEWEVKRLGDICDVRKQKFNPIENKNTKYIALEHIEQVTGRINGIGNSDETTSIKTKFKKGDILFGKLRPYLRKFWFSNFDGVCATEILPLFIKYNDISKFVFYVVQQDKFIEYTDQGSFGTKMPRTSWNEMKEFIFPLPSISEQKQISLILSSVDEQIEIADNLIKKTKELKKGLMQRLLTKGIGHERFKDTEIGMIPDEWEVRKLGDICEFKQGFQIPRSEQIIKEEEGYIRYLYITDFFSDSNKLYVKNDEKFYYITHKDITIANTGNTCGKAFRGASGVLSNNMFKIFNNDDLLCTEYLWQYLNSSLYWEQLKKYFNTAGQPHVGHKNMSELKIALPYDIKEQQKISNILIQVDEQIDQYQSKKEKLQELKKGLMQKLLTGKIRVKI